ncbi:MAG: hypothetical protein WAT66_04015 [Actinomycetota bacterium]
MRDIDRRTFLATSGLALAWLATGCGGKDDALPENASPNQLATDLKERDGDPINVLQAVDQVLVRPASRVAFALVAADRTTFLRGGGVDVYYGLDPSAPARGPVRAEYHGEGLGSKGVYVVKLDIDRPGNWGVVAVGKPSGASKEIWGEAVYPAVEKVDGPAPGAKAISIPTPTVENHRGVEPYCTRTPQPCSMHRISLDAALANGRPTVFNIGTPRFCTSQVCGPVVDVIQTVSTEFADRINFIHAEVYVNATDAPAKGVGGFTPAMKAWMQMQEPVTYWIRSDRTITERIVGPTDVAEVRALTRALTG